MEESVVPDDFSALKAILAEFSSSGPAGPKKISNSADFGPDNRPDSGVSTMESTSSRISESISEYLLSSENNNNNECMDVVRLLQLKSTDKEEQVSNSSSLESINSLDNHQGSGGSDSDDDSDESGSTSCSEDSFEMSSACSTRESTESSPLRERGSMVASQSSPENTVESFSSQESNQTISDAGSSYQLFRPPPYSTSMDSFITPNMVQNQKMNAIRQSIDAELNSLDTGLPTLDFEKLEKQLNNAAKEREEHERKLLGEEVRRRLALQVDATSAGPCPSIQTRPNKSNLAIRLQTAMNLQVCYMNDLAETTAESESDSDDEQYMIPKSKSAPNLKGACRPGSSKESPETKHMREKALDGQHLDGYERHTLLHAETRRVLGNAKQDATKSVDDFRRTKSKASVVPRQSRHHLGKMSAEQVRSIRDTLENAINQKNLELVNLLMDRDSLHMENDSLLVDIEDFTEHEAQASALDFHLLMRMQEGHIEGAPVHRSPTGPNYPGNKINNNNHIKSVVKSSKIAAFTPSTTPTSPTRTFVQSTQAHISNHFANLQSNIPISLSKFNLFRK